MRRSMQIGVRAGEYLGREDRSVIGWSARKRAVHFAAVAGEHWNRSAARRDVDDQQGKTKASFWSKGGITRESRGPPVRDMSVVTHILPEVLANSNDHNVPGNYN